VTRRRLAVLGSPVAHSLSPVLHRTAYALLDLPWDYDAVEVGPGSLAEHVRALGPSWRGLSLTMPLKREVLPLLDHASPLARRLGVANTLVLDDDGRRSGHNTDVDGIVRAVRGPEARVAPAPPRTPATVLGGGATAASALAAVAALGAREAHVHVRDTTRATDLARLAEELGLALVLRTLDDLDPREPRDLVVSTLPGGAADPLVVAPVDAASVLLDAAYDPWPSALAGRWHDSGAVAHSGLDMLVEQAIGQVRLFTGRAQDAPLPDEDGVRAAMRAAVGLPATGTPARAVPTPRLPDAGLPDAEGLPAAGPSDAAGPAATTGREG